jgi:lipoyl(octanoyl) transferase
MTPTKQPYDRSLPQKHPPLPKTQWRLIKTPPASGAWNMAVDEALLEGMTALSEPEPAPPDQAARPVLRLYAWQPPCLSLGYAQPLSDVDLQALKNRGWEIVRRPTGGRAILHTDELTYAVIGPIDEPRLAGGVLESYQRLSSALLNALHRMNIPAESQAEAIIPEGSDPKGPVCFEVPSSYEITLNGKKLIGSAQSRKRRGVLQHGSLPLHGDLQRITQVLRFGGEAARRRAAERLTQRATTVAEGLGAAITWDAAAQAFLEAFKATLDLEIILDELRPEEIARAEALVAEKYGNLNWTGRV